jgi:transposase-like protein
MRRDEVVITVRGKKHWLWRAVDQDGVVLHVLVQSRRSAKAARRLMRKLLKGQGRSPRPIHSTCAATITPARRVNRLSPLARGATHLAVQCSNESHLICLVKGSLLNNITQHDGRDHLGNEGTNGIFGRHEAA